METKEKPVDVQWGLPAAETAALVPASKPTAMAAQLAAGNLGGKPNLAAALVQAIAACQVVPHDAENTYHRYRYTSAEAILTEARQALSSNGLAVIPVSQSVNGHEREGPDRYELVQQRLLLHTSGESVLCCSAWPIIPEKGRPLDKATAAADTISLAYFLRDLLQMPRVDQADDVSARDDRDKAPWQNAPAQAVARIDEAQAAELSRLIRESGTDVAKLLAAYKIKALQQLPAASYGDCHAKLVAKIAKAQQPAETAATAPVATSPAEPKADTVEYGIAIRTLHKQLQKSGKTWIGAINWATGKPLPADWPEPIDEWDAAARVPDVMGREQCRKLEKHYQPKAKKAPAA